MKRSVLTGLFIFLLLTSCNKDDSPDTSGTVTINNEASFGNTWFINGFSITTGEKVSTENDPLDVITIMGTKDNSILKCYFDTRNYISSFFLYGQYDDEATCKGAFKNLVTINLPLQWTSIGDNLKENQIWLFRTSNENYAKIRIISTIVRESTTLTFPYAECTFEWVYQPDGTLTFPAR